MAVEAGGNIVKYMASQTQETRTANARKAGIASAKKRAAQKSWKASVEMLMAGTLSHKDAENIKLHFGLPDDVEDLTHQDMVLSAIARKAEAGDKDCAAFLRDTAGQSPAQMIKVGNLDGPFEALDLAALSDEQLRMLAERERPDPEK